MSNLGKKDLFWLMVSEISVHSQLAPLVLGLLKGRNILEERLLTSWQPGSKDETEEGNRIQNTQQGHTSPVVHFLQLAPAFHSSMTFH
jgi:hypothetical protein